MDESRLLRSPDVMIAEGPDRAAEPLVPLRRSAATGRPPVPLINAAQNADLRAGGRPVRRPRARPNFDYDHRMGGRGHGSDRDIW